MFACLYIPGLPEDEMPWVQEIVKRTSPLIEHIEPGTLVFSLAGTERLLGSPKEVARRILKQLAERELGGNLAVASNPDAALYAARSLHGITVILPGEEAARLGKIPVNELPLPPEMLETLAAWGICTFAQFAALPGHGIMKRFGLEGLRLQNIARGSTGRPLVRAPETVRYEGRSELDYALDNLEPLLFVINGLLTDLCRELQRHTAAALEIHLGLELQDGQAEEHLISLPVPQREAPAMLKLLQIHLEASPPEKAITAVRLKLVPTRPRVVQSSLFSLPAPEPAKLQMTLARIAVLVGEANVGSPELIDTHRPDAFIVRPFAQPVLKPAPEDPAPASLCLTIRRFRPPVAAQVRMENGAPGYVNAASIAGKVMTFSGPWRGSGDWWNKLEWDHDEWDVALQDGTLCKLYRRSGSMTWFMGGVYD